MSSTTVRSDMPIPGRAISVRRLAAALLAVTLLGALFAPAALAQETDDTEVTVSGGSLSVTAITVANFGEVTLDGTTQTTEASMDPFEVSDYRGTGEGWQLTAVATQFTETGDCGEDCETLPFDSLTMLEPTVVAQGETNEGQEPGTSDPGSIDSEDGTASPIATTDSGGDGMGEFEFTIGNLSLDIPPDAVAATYRSTVTIDLTTGP